MPPGGSPVSVTGCLSIRKKNMYGLGMGIRKVSEILGFL